MTLNNEQAVQEDHILPLDTDFHDADEPSQPPLILPDLHGCLHFLNEVVRLNPGRHLLFLGDLIDRGPSTPELIERVQQLDDEGWVDAILYGNHEAMAIGGFLLGDSTALRTWMMNGGDVVLSQYVARDGNTTGLIDDLEWLYAVGQHYAVVDTPRGKLFCVHGSIPADFTDFPLDADIEQGGLASPHLWRFQGEVEPEWIQAVLPVGWRTVHGHVPQVEPAPMPRYDAKRRAYYLDTGGVFNGWYAYLDADTGGMDVFYLPRQTHA